MAIDFFQHQDLARKKTGFLVAYFVLAVICIIAAVYLAFVAILFAGRNAGKDEGNRAEFSAATLWQPDVLAAVGLGTLALVGGVAGYWFGLHYPRPTAVVTVVAGCGFGLALVRRAR
jgi:hypothetical protein